MNQHILRDMLKEILENGFLATECQQKWLTNDQVLPEKVENT